MILFHSVGQMICRTNYSAHNYAIFSMITFHMFTLITFKTFKFINYIFENNNTEKVFSRN